jgi:ATP-dependent Lon protease
MKPRDMLSIPLSSLIRLHGDSVAKDAKTLALNILAPYKKELPPTLHKFSVDLLFLVIMHLSVDDKRMKSVVEFITDKKHGSEFNMFELVSNITMLHMQNAEALAIAERLKNVLKTMGKAEALRLVSAANYQWCAAFGLPQAQADSPFHYSKNADPDKKENKNGKLKAAQIRVGTSFDLQDATAVAHDFLAPVQNATDAYGYAFAGNLLVLVLINVCHEHRIPKIGHSILFLVDNRWDTPLQTIHWLAGQNGAPLVGSEKYRAFRDEWYEKMNTMSSESKEIMIFRSIELIQRAMKLKDDLYLPVPAAIGTTTAPFQSSNEIPANSVQVFSMEALGRAQTLMGDVSKERKGGGDRILESAQANNGYRAIPDGKKAYEALEQAKGEFENLHEAIEFLQHNLVLASAMKTEKFRVRPILLLGDPGIGKTMIATTLSKSMGGGMEKISAGGSTGGFQLNGSHSSWTGGRPGQIFKALAESEFASPVVVIDEIDKMGGDNRYPVLPVLLDLLEPETAMVFRDEFFEINVDASRIIFILTANSIANVPAPLLSRVTVFNVQRPAPAQRLRIIENEVKNLCEATDSKINLDKVSAQKLADRVDIDLRVTVSIIQESFAKAIMAKNDLVELVIKKDVYTGEKPDARNRSPIYFVVSKPETETEEPDGISRTMH